MKHTLEPWTIRPLTYEEPTAPMPIEWKDFAYGITGEVRGAVETRSSLVVAREIECVCLVYAGEFAEQNARVISAAPLMLSLLHRLFEAAIKSGARIEGENADPFYEVEQLFAAFERGEKTGVPKTL
jgi:hypothetical protein